MTERKLVRRTDEGMIGGVAAGVADYLDIDPTLVRLAFVALVFFGGIGALLYVVMWILVPKPEHITAPPREAAKSNVDDIVAEARRTAESVRDAVRSDRRGGGSAEAGPGESGGSAPSEDAHDGPDAPRSSS